MREPCCNFKQRPGRHAGRALCSRARRLTARTLKHDGPRNGWVLARALQRVGAALLGCHSGARRKARARNPVIAGGAYWIPGSLATLGPRNDSRVNGRRRRDECRLLPRPTVTEPTIA